MSNNNAASPSLNVINSISPTDDDISLTTTSAESETFESWTLITDKQKAKAAADQQQPSTKETTKTNTTTNDLCSRVEVLRNETSNVTNLEAESNSETLCELGKEQDDFSDGISIISESSESVGRMSPHPLLEEHLHRTLPSLLKEPTTYKDAVDTMETDDDLDIRKDIKRRRRSSSHQALQTAQELPNNNLMALLMHFGTKPAVKQGLSAVFYTGVALALFAFMGQLRYSEYVIVNGKSLENFQQKINELELQNNLISAEIDLLNKQVNYLTDVYEKTRGFGENGKSNSERKSGKTFKAWSGNGNKMDPVHIKKEDLKRAYKCGTDNEFVEIGGMCVENKPSIDELASLIDEVGTTVNDVLQDRETYKSFEKVAEAFLNKGNQDKTITEPVSVTEPPTNAKYYKEYVPTMPNIPNTYDENSKEKNYKKPYRKTQKKYDDSLEDNDDEDSHEKRHKRVYSSKERGNNSKERGNNSKERGNNSKERRRGNRGPSDYDKNDNKRQHKSYGSGERKNKDAQWHENLMLQREELRRLRQKYNEHQNWYIERGESREQARNS